LSSIVRSVSINNERDNQRSTQNTPTPWDNQTVRERPRSRESNSRQRDSKDSREYQSSNRDQQSQRDSRDSQRERIERYRSDRSHGRNPSTGTGTGNSSFQGDYAERRHDYDLEAMEADLSSPRMNMPKRPIPPPIVTVRSEYPSLTRSKQSQTLTCLISIEVPEGKWSPDADDLRLAPEQSVHHQEKEVVSPRPDMSQEQRDYYTDSPEELEVITEDLRMRVENWHGLDFTR
jgi:hypothetical protein